MTCQQKVVLACSRCPRVILPVDAGRTSFRTVVCQQNKCFLNGFIRRSSSQKCIIQTFQCCSTACCVLHKSSFMTYFPVLYDFTCNSTRQVRLLRHPVSQIFSILPLQLVILREFFLCRYGWHCVVFWAGTKTTVKSISRQSSPAGYLTINAGKNVGA